MTQNRINELCIQISKLKADLKDSHRTYLEATKRLTRTTHDDALEEAAIAMTGLEKLHKFGDGSDTEQSLAYNHAATAIRAMKGKDDD